MNNKYTKLKQVTSINNDFLQICILIDALYTYITENLLSSKKSKHKQELFELEQLYNNILPSIAAVSTELDCARIAKDYLSKTVFWNPNLIDQTEYEKLMN